MKFKKYMYMKLDYTNFNSINSYEFINNLTIIKMIIFCFMINESVKINIFNFKEILILRNIYYHFNHLYIK